MRHASPFLFCRALAAGLRFALLAAALAVALTHVSASAAMPEGASVSAVDTVVYPTGVFPTDRDNVSAAVNAGGTVLLKAVDVFGVPTAFNFGNRGVNMTKALAENNLTIL